ncbi:IQ domain-containing protein C [Rana temporaria]|uniref:IQ domain-containing protein C n=1 Tax=Rana temporaria TaxID=8407 RepID=UPI001AAC8944|nr:IQ domain-containing protein C [Rana temporaria]
MMEEEEAAAIVLQAHARGVLARRRLRRVLQDYEAVVRDIEGEDIAVQWGARLLSPPLFNAMVQHRGTTGLGACKGNSHGGGRHTRNTDPILLCSDRKEAGQEPEHEPCTLEKEYNHYQPSETEEVPAECQLPGAASESEHLSGKPSRLQDVPTREYQVSETTDRKMESPLLEMHALRPESPDRDCLHQGKRVSGETDTLPVTQGQTFPYHSNISNTNQRYESLEWTRSSSVWSDKSMDADLSLKNPNELQMLRSHLAMEILWVQQAIASRKNYLMVRQRMGIES